MILYQIYLEAKFRVRRKFSKPQKWQIFGQRIELPSSHRLPLLQKLYPSYDTYYSSIIKKIEEHYPGSCLIDVGANVGDTSIGVLNCAPSFKVVAVEGNEFFLDYLKINVMPLGEKISLVPRFVKCQSVGDISYLHDGSTGGFVTSSVNGETDYEKVSVADLLASHESQLVIWKSDTDGLDVPIVLENYDLLVKRSGIWWLELDPSMEPTNIDLVSELIHATSKSNRSYILFDNFGNKISKGSVFADELEILRKLKEIPKTFKLGSKDARYYDIFIIDINKYPKLTALL